MTVLFNNRTTDGDSAEHTIATDITTITATGDNWERVRLILLLETTTGSGVYVAVPDWEMTNEGSKNAITQSAAGLKLKLLLLGTSLTDVTPKISADAN